MPSVSDRELAILDACSLWKETARARLDGDPTGWDFAVTSLLTVAIAERLHGATVDLQPTTPEGIETAASWVAGLEDHIIISASPKPPDTARPEGDDIVTLTQAAAMIHKSKRTLERWPLPDPDYPGGDGVANRWRWSTLKPALEDKAGMILPERFPGSHLI